MRCPAGHETTATDYCDTCGLAVDAAGQRSAAPVPPAGAASDAAADAAGGTCPHCSQPTPPHALFCENCGYDFTTGALPRPEAPASDPAAPADPAAAVGDPVTDPVSEPVPTPAGTHPAPPTEERWVAEIWIDPDWYADQQSTDPLPSPGLPTVVALRRTSLLIGRSSRSRGIDPGIELDTDSGVSRRHAQLTTDGSRWFVEDLGSSNGTYVGGGLGSLPGTPIPVGQKTEVTGDDRIYLGAWTRIVLRKAEPGEVA